MMKAKGKTSGFQTLECIICSSIYLTLAIVVACLLYKGPIKTYNAAETTYVNDLYFTSVGNNFTYL